MTRYSILLGVFLLAGLGACARATVGVPARPAVPDYPALDRRFVAEVQPVLKTYCFSCHSGPSPASMLDLTAHDSTAEIVAAFATWEHVHSRLELTELVEELVRSRKERS